MPVSFVLTSGSVRKTSEAVIQILDGEEIDPQKGLFKTCLSPIVYKNYNVKVALSLV